MKQLLSLREKELCRNFQLGNSDEEISEKMNIDIETVKRYKRRIKNKGWNINLLVLSLS